MAEMSVLKVVEHGRLAILPMFRQISISKSYPFQSNFTKLGIVFFTTLICSQRLRLIHSKIMIMTVDILLS